MLLCFVASTMAGLSAGDDSFVAPPVPDTRLVDESRLFVRSPERREVIEERLLQLEDRHRFRLYYVIYDSLFGRDISARTHALKDAWLKEQPGLVMVMVADTGAFQVAQSEREEVIIEPGQPIALPSPLELSPTELSGIIRSMEGSLRESQDREDFAIRLGTGLAEGVTEVFDERQEEPATNTSTKMIVLAVGLIAATGLIALLIVAGLRRAEAKSLERYVFPKIAVGVRLGAPYGGGKISCRSFQNPPSGK